MRISYLFMFGAVVALIFGLGFTLLTEQVMSIYGVKSDAAGVLTARLFGTTLVGIGALQWLARNAEDSQTRRAIVLSLFTIDALGLVVVFFAQLAGTVNGLGWVNIAIYVVLTLGYGYFLLAGSAADTMKATAS